MTCRLSDLVSPAFYDVGRSIKTGDYTEYVLKGGRGSAKSSFVSIEVPKLLIKHPGTHAVVMRKIGNTLRTSVFAQYVWAISEMGLQDKFKATVSPMEIVYKQTGQKIMFFSADDPGKLKSIKVPFGYVAFLHFEELDQFSGEEEIRNIEQSVLRGGPLAYEFKTFNPPQSISNWANQYCMRSKPGQLIHHSTYLTTPHDWLGDRFLSDAEYLKQINPRAYAHEYLGEANGTGGMVFENVTLREIKADEIEQYDRRYQGVDWGYYPDPWAWNHMHFDAGRRVLYIFDELTAYKRNNRQTAEMLIDKGVTPQQTVICDSAEKKSVMDYREYGIMARGVDKWPGSVEITMKWLQGLTEIVIDPARCPDTAREFTSYEYERTKAGEIISGYPDRDNHHIDAVRYGLNPIWRRRGQ